MVPSKRNNNNSHSNRYSQYNSKHLENPPFPAYHGNEPYIFVSYSHLDSYLVYPELERFKKDGYNIWYDEGIDSGRGWPQEIENAIINAYFFVIFISANAVKSKQVNNEINLAIKRNIKIIPIYLEETELKNGLDLLIGHIQSIYKFKLNEKNYVRKYREEFRKLKFGPNNRAEQLINKIESKSSQLDEENRSDYLKFRKLYDMAIENQNEDLMDQVQKGLKGILINLYVEEYIEQIENKPADIEYPSLLLKLKRKSIRHDVIRTTYERLKLLKFPNEDLANTLIMDGDDALSREDFDALEKIVVKLYMDVQNLIDRSEVAKIDAAVMLKNKRIKGANVLLSKDKEDVYNCTTDNQGKCNFENVPFGEYEVTIKAESLVDNSTKVKVDNDYVALLFNLKKDDTECMNVSITGIEIITKANIKAHKTTHATINLSDAADTPLGEKNVNICVVQEDNILASDTLTTDDNGKASIEFMPKTTDDIIISAAYIESPMEKDYVAEKTITDIKAMGIKLNITTKITENNTNLLKIRLSDEEDNPISGIVELRIESMNPLLVTVDKSGVAIVDIDTIRDYMTITAKVVEPSIGYQKVSEKKVIITRRWNKDSDIKLFLNKHKRKLYPILQGKIPEQPVADIPPIQVPIDHDIVLEEISQMEHNDNISIKYDSEYLNRFQKLNRTTDNIYDLEDNKVLIILNDGTNLTSWNEVKDRSEILYISEDLSDCSDLTKKYDGLSSLEAIVALGDTQNVTSMNHMFSGCSSLVEISSLKNWNTENVADMSNMFLNCSSLTDISALENWNTGNVTTLEMMFYACSSLADISPLKNWNTCNVMNMNGIFRACSSLSDISALENWNTSEVRKMKHIFNGCFSLNDISSLHKWDTGNVTTMRGMFRSCSAITHISSLKKWNTGNVTILTWMFKDCSSLSDVSCLNDWNTDSATKMDDMFEGCSSLMPFKIGRWRKSKYPKWYEE